MVAEEEPIDWMDFNLMALVDEAAGPLSVATIMYESVGTIARTATRKAA